MGEPLMLLLLLLLLSLKYMIYTLKSALLIDFKEKMGRKREAFVL